DIIVGAGFQPFDLVLPAAAGGQYQNRVVQTGFAHVGNDVQPRRPRQADVDDRDINRIFGGVEQAFLAFAGAVDGKAVVTQLSANLFPQFGIVFDDQRSHSSSRLYWPPAARRASARGRYLWALMLTTWMRPRLISRTR